MISIDNNIADNIIRKVIDVWQDKCETKNEDLRNLLDTFAKSSH